MDNLASKNPLYTGLWGSRANVKAAITAYEIIDDAQKDYIEFTLLHQVAKESRRETGCLAYEIFQDLNKPSIFVVVEVFVSAAAAKYHVNTLYMKKLLHMTGPTGGLRMKIIELNMKAETAWLCNENIRAKKDETLTVLNVLAVKRGEREAVLAACEDYRQLILDKVEITDEATGEKRRVT